MNTVSLDWLSEILDKRREEQLYRSVLKAESHAPGKIQIEGRWLNNFGANDYLGLASHPDVLAAARTEPINDSPYGSGASPLVTGYTNAHASLEKALVEFEGAEDAILFSTGYAANVGTISALASREDLILSDALNHASLIDGCRLSRARTIVYPHLDSIAVRESLKVHRSTARRAFIVTDSIFSMDGDTAPLSELAEIADSYDATLIIDEAHATGVLGQHGGGLAEACGLADRIPVRIGTLSKALGCLGGFVVGSQGLIDYLRNFSRTYIYSTAMPLANARAAQVALGIARTMNNERDQLRYRSIELRKQLKELGFHVGAGVSPIVPVYLATSEQALAFSSYLRQAGHFVPAIRPPTVPHHQSLLRISLSIALTPEQLRLLVESFSDFSKLTR